MPKTGNPATISECQRRTFLHAERLRPVRLWLPDTRSAAFREKCERESLSLAADPLEAETLVRIAKAADTRDWE
jgi:hypothetical protein